MNPRPGDVVTLYLVERYVPSMTAADLEAAVARIDELSRGQVRHLWTIVVAAEDTCLSVFEGPDSAAVEEVNAMAGFRLDRVVEIASVEIGRSRPNRTRSSPRPASGRTR